MLVIIVFFTATPLWKKNLVLLKNVLNESVNIVNFIKPCPLSTCFIMTLFDYVLCILKYNGCLKEWHFCSCLNCTKLFFFYGIPLKKILIDRLWLFKTLILGRSFPQWAKRIFLLLMIKFKLSSKNENVEKTSQYLKTFLMKLMVFEMCCC